MRLGQVRNGSKFVFEDRGGVWQKTADDRARCIFGKKGEYGTEIPVSSESFVFGLFDRPFDRSRGPSREPAPTMVAGGGHGMGMKVVIADVDDETILMEIADATAAQVAALSVVEGFRMKAPRKRIPREYRILDTAVDVSENTLFLMVRPDKVAGKEETEEEETKNELHTGAVQAGTPVGPAVEGERDGVHFEDAGGPVPPVPQTDGVPPGPSV